LAATINVNTLASTSPNRAYDYVSQLPRHGEWATDDLTIEPVAAGPVRVGSTFSSAGTEPFLGGRVHHMKLTVTNVEPGRRFAFDSEDGLVVVHHEFRFSEVPGGTRIDREATWTKRPVAHHVLFPLILRRSLQKRFSQAQARLKDRLEQSAFHS